MVARRSRIVLCGIQNRCEPALRGGARRTVVRRAKAYIAGTAVDVAKGIGMRAGRIADRAGGRLLVSSGIVLGVALASFGLADGAGSTAVGSVWPTSCVFDSPAHRLA